LKLNYGAPLSSSAYNLNLRRYIEVNTSPALFRHGRCLTEMLPRMMEECVQKCVDVVFPPPLLPEAAVGPARY